MLSDKKISADVDNNAKAWIAEKGYDPAYGARPLKRVIQNTILNPLATMIIEGKVAENDKVTIIKSDTEDKLLFKVRKPSKKETVESAPTGSASADVYAEDL
jgi:ATP-dependent Clp protease ATP-binding subunit ClpB